MCDRQAAEATNPIDAAQNLFPACKTKFPDKPDREFEI
jgi:hypothetical protein